MPGRTCAPEPSPPAETPPADAPSDVQIACDAYAFAKEEIEWLIRDIRMQPSDNPVAAAARARDARTRGQLVRMLAQLQTLERSRSADKRKTKVRDDAERKAALIRKINQVVDAGRTKPGSGESEPG